jgi:hypothetical protein
MVASGIWRRMAARLPRLRLQVAAYLDLAATDALGDLFAHRHFEETQILADAKADVEIARIDALDLEIQHGAAQIAAGGGITGHAVDHGLGGDSRGFVAADKGLQRASEQGKSRQYINRSCATTTLFAQNNHALPPGCELGRVPHRKAALGRWLFHRLPGA